MRNMKKQLAAFYLFLINRVSYYRKIFLFLAILLITLSRCTALYAQSNGFIIRENGDSIPANIKIYKALFGGVNLDRYQKHVEIEDSAGHMQWIDPTELTSFSFTYNGTLYQLYSVPIRLRPSNDTATRFLPAWIKGSKASVYKYSGPPMGMTGSREDYYTFEKPGNKHEYLASWIKLNTFIEKLSAFYGEFPGIVDLINNKFIERKNIPSDIKEIIDKINED
jgi:hypothetical protein